MRPSSSLILGASLLSAANMLTHTPHVRTPGHQRTIITLPSHSRTVSRGGAHAPGRLCDHSHIRACFCGCL